MNIGDVFFALRGDGSGLQVDAKKAGAAAGTTAGKSFNQKLSDSFKSGLGIGAGIGAFSLLTSAVGGTVDALDAVVKGAIADEESVARLSASLKANVPAWDGNTEAIEANIKAKQRLGFDDETLRDSLAVLVGATHDVTEAQEIQNTAMDLARFKKIDLKTASEALIKVEGGAYRSLKQLGIKLKDNATSTEALAAVQAVASGQAEEFADTTAGSMEAMNIAIDEAGEAIGVKLLPMMDKIVGFVNLELVPALEDAAKPDGAIDQVVDALSDLGNSFDPDPAYEAASAVGELDRAVSDFISDAIDFNTPWDTFVSAENERAAALEDTADNVREMNRSITTASGSASSWSGGFTRAAKLVSQASEGTAQDIKRDNAAVQRSYETLTDSLLGSFSDNFDTAMGIVDARAALSAGRHEAAALRKKIASGKLTSKEIADARARIKELDIESVAHYEKLAEMGALSQTGYDAWLAVVEKLAAGTKGKVHESYMAAIKDIRALKAAASGNINVSVTYRKTAKPGQAAEPRASGGPVVAGGLYKVNENTPRTEFFAPEMDGRILTHAQGVEAMGSGSGSGNTITIYNPEPRPAEADIARVLRRVAALGIA